MFESSRCIFQPRKNGIRNFECGDTELEHETMLRVDQVLAEVDTPSELEVIRFAA